MCALQCSHHICGNKRECTFQVRSGIRAALCFWRFVLEGRLFVCHPCVCMFLPTAARLRQRLSTYDLQPGPLECPQLPTRTMAYDTRQQHFLSRQICWQVSNCLLYQSYRRFRSFSLGKSVCGSLLNNPTVVLLICTNGYSDPCLVLCCNC